MVNHIEKDPHYLLYNSSFFNIEIKLIKKKINFNELDLLII